MSGPAQAAGLAALRDRAYLESVVTRNAAGRAWVRDRLGRLGIESLPSVANFNTCRIGEPGSGTAVRAVEFLAARNILIRPLVPVGLPDLIRITVGLERENEALVDGLTAFFAADSS